MRVHGEQAVLIAVISTFLLALSAPARGELVFFATGRSLSVKGHRLDGDSLVLILRHGGEIICDPSVVTSIEPDEVPYPEPEPEAARASNTIGSPLVRYAEIIDRFAAQHGVNPRLVRAVIQAESAYEERALSRKGAMGLMQLMPETARQYAVADPYEPSSNIEAGIKHLKGLLERFDLPVALAAYNAGEATIRRFGGIPPYRETRDYVSRVLRLFGQENPRVWSTALSLH